MSSYESHGFFIFFHIFQFLSTITKNMNQELFQKEYDRLNDAQKQAVDTIYGPVMVIA